MFTEAERIIVEQAIVILERALERGAAMSDPQMAGRFMAGKLRHLEHEVFVVMFLDTRHRVLAFEEMFRGTLDGAEVHPREVARAALRHNVNSNALLDRHPPNGRFLQHSLVLLTSLTCTSAEITNMHTTESRKPSPKVLARTLWKQAYRAEASAQKLRKLGLERYADAVNDAATHFSDAAVALENANG